MRLVNPRTGSIVETTDPVHIIKLIYGEGYWVVGPRADQPLPGDDQHPTLTLDQRHIHPEQP